MVDKTTVIWAVAMDIASLDPAVLVAVVASTASLGTVGITKIVEWAISKRKAVAEVDASLGSSAFETLSGMSEQFVQSVERRLQECEMRHKDRDQKVDELYRVNNGMKRALSSALWQIDNLTQVLRANNLEVPEPPPGLSGASSYLYADFILKDGAPKDGRQTNPR